MHDPKIVLFEIKRPWPKRGSKARGKVWKRRFWFDGYLPALATVWHVDPEKDGDDDSCLRGRLPIWTHVHHWSITFDAWRRLKRWLFTRCYVCAGRLPYGYAPLRDRWLREGQRKPGPRFGEFGVRHHDGDRRCDAEAQEAWKAWRWHRKESWEMEQELRSMP